MDPSCREAVPWDISLDRPANLIYLPFSLQFLPPSCTSVIATIVIYLLNVIRESCYKRLK